MHCAAGQVEIRIGDCLDLLRQMPDQSVHCVVTSPPYFGLRDYGTGEWQGGDPDCKHVVGEMRRGLGLADSVASIRGGGHKAAEVDDVKARDVCPHCGAVRVDGQIGLEASPAEFIGKLVEVFREVRRVLCDDGTCWVNMGDSYCSSRGPGWQGKNGERADRRFTGTRNTVGMREASRGALDAFKPKDIMGMPWRLAFALQDDGWYLRQDIIWHKPNPMPESVRDRCTKAHEYIFLLTKQPRYYWDQEAIREPAEYGFRSNPSAQPKEGRSATSSAMWRNAGDGREAVERGHDQRGATYDPSAGRNKRSVWTVSTESFSGAHFATYPPKLIEPCILAGCPKGGTVLDPFGGAGTTGLVAARHGRRAILLELNPEYAAIAQRRISEEWREPVEQSQDDEPLLLFGGVG
ncbi:MAG: site-specific DNA-methyltransferase [Pseudomonadota bacterium]